MIAIKTLSEDFTCCTWRSPCSICLNAKTDNLINTYFQKLIRSPGKTRSKLTSSNPDWPADTKRTLSGALPPQMSTTSKTAPSTTALVSTQCPNLCIVFSTSRAGLAPRGTRPMSAYRPCERNPAATPRTCCSPVTSRIGHPLRGSLLCPAQHDRAHEDRVTSSKSTRQARGRC